MLGRLQRLPHNLLRLGHNGLQVLLVPEALGVNLVEVLRAGRPGGEPPRGGDDFQAADRGVIARRAGEPGGDGFPGKLGRGDRFRREFLEGGFLGGRGRRVNARVVRRAEGGGQFAEMLARILAGARSDFSGQKAEQDAVFVRGPDRAIVPEETRPGALLAA